MPPDSINSEGLPRVVEAVGFVVNERPVAVYGAGLRKASLQFVEQFSATFWEHQLELAASALKDSPTHDHVTFVRIALSHAEEHLFALIFAFLQAPHCPDLWLYRYKQEDLERLVAKVEAGEKVLSRFDLGEPSWEKIVRVLWPSLDEKRCRLTGVVLHKLAKRFSSDFSRDEYNGMKHGMRLSFGGHAISFSPGGSPDVMPSPESFISFGDSKFGCRFWALEKVPGAKDHFRAKLRMSNWDFHELGHYLTHATLLIGNMGAAFRVFAGVDGDREFRFFTGDAAYENEPRKLQGLVSGEMVAKFDLTSSDLLNLDDVRKSYF